MILAPFIHPPAGAWPGEAPLPSRRPPETDYDSESSRCTRLQNGRRSAQFTHTNLESQCRHVFHEAHWTACLTLPRSDKPQFLLRHVFGCRVATFHAIFIEDMLED